MPKGIKATKPRRFLTMPQAPHIIQIVVTLTGLGMVVLILWELWMKRPPKA